MTRLTPRGPLHLLVPGSTSNLGPGFDVLGLAVDRGLEVRWLPGDGPLEVERSGTLASLHLRPDQDHLVRAICRGASRWADVGGQTVEAGMLGGTLEVSSRIPVARGLGSSAAARLAGLLLGGGLGPEVPEPGEVLAVAARGEGHPDNVAPALHGGLVAAGWSEEEPAESGDDAPDEDGAAASVAEEARSAPRGVRVVSLPLSPEVGWCYAAPAAVVRTDEARAVLPATVPHASVGSAGARLAVLLHGLATADGDAVGWGIQDRVHTPWRLPLVPGGEAAVAAAREAGAWGATLSGSGSGIVAAGPVPVMTEVRDAMARVFAGRGDGGDRHAFVFRPDPRGARWLAGPPDGGGG